MSFIHTTKEGKNIKLEDMDNSHLLNTIGWLERKAKKGIKVEYGCAGPEFEDMWYDVDLIKGEEARVRLRIDEYIQEVRRRGLVI